VLLLQEKLADSLFTTLESLCPGLYVERSPLSVRHLTQGVSTPHAYKPRDVVLAQLAGTTCLLADSVDIPEQLIDLVTFGSAEVSTHSLLT